MSKPQTWILCCATAVMALVGATLLWLDKHGQVNHEISRVDSGVDSRTGCGDVADGPITLQFDDLSSDSKKEVEDLIAKAIANAVNNSWRDIDIKDELERELFEELDRRLPRPRECDRVAYSIYVIRPGEGQSSATTVPIPTDSRVSLRFVRMTVRVDRPIAIIQMCRISMNMPLVEERVLYYVAGKGWMSVEQMDMDGDPNNPNK